MLIYGKMSESSMPQLYAFRCKIALNVRMLLLKESVHCLPVTDISFHKSEIMTIHYRCTCEKFSCVSQFIQIKDVIVLICIKHVDYKITYCKSTPPITMIGLSCFLTTNLLCYMKNFYLKDFLLYL